MQMLLPRTYKKTNFPVQPRDDKIIYLRSLVMKLRQYENTNKLPNPAANKDVCWLCGDMQVAQKNWFGAVNNSLKANCAASMQIAIITPLKVSFNQKNLAIVY